MKEKTKEKTNELLSLSQAAHMSGYTPEYFNLLSRKKKLKAEKIGRNWYTKKEWVDEFLATVSTGENSNLADFSEDDKTEKKDTENFSMEEDLQNENNDKINETKIAEEEKIGQKEFFSGESKKSKFEKIETKSDWNKIFAAAASAIILLPLVFAGTQVAKKFVSDYKNNSELVSLSEKQNENFGQQIVNENSIKGEVAGETTVAADKNKIILASENYKINNINIGGNIMVLANGENQPLQVDNIKSESFVDAKNNEAKLVVSWQTNKMAISELGYSKNGGQDFETLGENSYGFNHSAVVAGLDPGTSYVYQIKCKDRWANENNSDYFGIYTSSKPVSVFDLISNAVGEVFGWAIKK